MAISIRIEKVEHEPKVFVIQVPAIMTFMTAVVLTVSLTIFILSAVNGSKLAQLAPKPLAIYADIFPGQPAAILDRYPCHHPQVSESSLEAGPPSLCQIFPSSGDFHLIQAHVEHGEIIELSLYSRGVQPELLISYWGAPHIMERTSGGRNFRMEWNNGLYRATAVILQPERLAYRITLRLK
jgi:hypothetical protein